MDLTSIVAAASETRLEGKVPRLVHLQGIDSLAPWWTPSTSCPPWRRWWRSLNRLIPQAGAAHQNDLSVQAALRHPSYYGQVHGFPRQQFLVDEVLQ
jgi:hypothetical protein